MHEQPHPKSGRTFRVNINDGDVQAGYDRFIHGETVRLVDWADRMEQNSTLTPRQIEASLMFYAHRSLPDLPPLDPVPVDAINWENLVYVTRAVTFDGKTRESIDVLHESELIELPDLTR